MIENSLKSTLQTTVFSKLRIYIGNIKLGYIYNNNNEKRLLWYVNNTI